MRLILFLTLAALSNAGIPAGAIWTVRSGATSANANGAFFNPGNANFPTDGTVDTNTGNTNSPVFSSASYNFVAGDVGAWLYVKSGTNTYPGWYQIASVASNKATLTATIGAAVLHNSTNRTYTASTAAGIASVGTPTSITWGIDYSQGTSALCSPTDMVIDATTNTDITSTTCAFSTRHIGNGVRVGGGTGFTTGWYEIVSIPSGTTARLDRPVGTLSSTGGTGKVGGAASLGSGSAPTDDTLLENGIAGNDWFIENGSYTVGGTISLSAAGGSQNPIRIIGYNSLRGDAPTTTSRPTLDVGANSLTLAANWNVMYLRFTGTASSTLITGSNTTLMWVKSINTSTTASRNAFAMAADTACYFCEGISYRGRGLTSTSTPIIVYGGYFHDSDVGVLLANNGAMSVLNSIVANNFTAAISVSASVAGAVTIDGNTLYGAEQNPTGPTNGIGTGISLATGVTDVRITNNIIKGFATGISATDSTQTVGISAYNAFHGNATDLSGFQIGPGSVTGTAPGFTSVTQQTGTGATSASSTITAASGTPFTSVVDNQDFITVISATTATAGKYLITSHTDNTVTVSPSIGTGTNIIWEVTFGHDFSIGTNLSASGYPGIFPGALTTGYKSTGAVGKQGGGGTRIY